MTECPLEHHARFPMLKEEPICNFASRHAQLSLRGKRALDRLLVLLPSHLQSHLTPHGSPFPPALLYSICGALQPEDSAAEQDDPSVLPSVLSKLRDWRLLDPDYRYSLGAIHKLAVDLAGIIDEAFASPGPDLNRTSHPRLRMKWVSSDSPSEIQHGESSLPTPPPSRSGALDSAQECARALSDLNGRRPDVGYAFCQVGRLVTPDSEDTGAVVSPRHRSVSGFRSGCSACRHLRSSGLSAPPSPNPYTVSVPFTDVNQFDKNLNHGVPASPRHPKLIVQHATPKKTKRNKPKALQSAPRGADVDENEPPVSQQTVIHQAIGVTFPRQRTARTPHKSNTPSSREPFSPIAASVQPLEPNQARQGDKHAASHRVTSVDLLSSVADPRPRRASPNDHHPHPHPHAQSFSPEKSHGVGGCPKLSSNAVASRSSKRLPSWSQTRLVRPPATTTPSVTPPPATARLENPHARPSSARRSRPSSTSIPRSVPNDMNVNMKRRDRSLASSQTCTHTSSDGVLASPVIRARRWQV